MRFITKSRMTLTIYRLLVGIMVMAGAMMSLNMVWSLADITMGLMTLCNLIAITMLGGKVILLLADYRSQKRKGIDPVFRKSEIKEFANDDSIECW